MENLAFGLQVTAVGMGIVFGLLAALWLLLTLVLRFEQRGEALEPAATPSEGVAGAAVVVGAAALAGRPPAGPVRLVGAPADLDPRLVAAVSVAVLRHADARRRQAAPAMRSYWPGSLLFASRWVAAGRMRQGQIWRRRAK